MTLHTMENGYVLDVGGKGYIAADVPALQQLLLVVLAEQELKKGG